MDSVNMGSSAVINNPEKSRYASVRRKKNLFFFLMALPFLIVVAVFYLYVNISSFAMAFLEYELVERVGDVSTFVWFKNFSTVLNIIFSPEEVSMIGFSFLMYAFVLCFITPVVIFFSFYIYKNFLLSSFFRVVLFMPQIVSSVVYVTLYKTMLGPIYMQLSGAEIGLLYGDTTNIMLSLIFFVFWTGFGTNILLMSGAMSAIDNSIVEACYLDGCNMTKEFIHVTLPSIYPTITTFIVLDLTTLFTNTMHLYTFFDAGAPVKSVGYYIEVNTMNSPGLVHSNKLPWLTYPELSALGFLITIIVTPVTLTVRRLLEKFGPSED